MAKETMIAMATKLRMRRLETNPRDEGFTVCFYLLPVKERRSQDRVCREYLSIIARPPRRLHHSLNETVPKQDVPRRRYVDHVDWMAPRYQGIADR